ncbi:hypothetical protein G4Y79_23050 [Phototrophicus methaneseepsis]|uniref:Uncharacterized protein n=1 Tax=Phototrophicus methaneseepsis TaxID=2710758 RepID=A0A7S8IEK0_9CHLR|nr:hypothetical protein [Phototrophicus methaneseepsis]QPC82529.1 hypothetical protein G4Y79_23050 [Phototrophicus methaneseepsis]
MMVFGTMKWYVYLLIAVGVFAFFLLFGILAGDGVINLVSDMRTQAVSAGTLPVVVADVIVEPIIFALQGEIVNSAIVGLLWPLAVIWLLLLAILLIFAYVLPGLGIARGAFN